MELAFVGRWSKALTTIILLHHLICPWTPGGIMETDDLAFSGFRFLLIFIVKILSAGKINIEAMRLEIMSGITT